MLRGAAHFLGGRSQEGCIVKASVSKPEACQGDGGWHSMAGACSRRRVVRRAVAQGGDELCYGCAFEGVSSAAWGLASTRWPRRPPRPPNQPLRLLLCNNAAGGRRGAWSAVDSAVAARYHIHTLRGHVCIVHVQRSTRTLRVWASMIVASSWMCRVVGTGFGLHWQWHLDTMGCLLSRRNASRSCACRPRGPCIIPPRVVDLSDPWSGRGPRCFRAFCALSLFPPPPRMPFRLVRLLWLNTDASRLAHTHILGRGTWLVGSATPSVGMVFGRRGCEWSRTDMRWSPEKPSRRLIAPDGGGAAEHEGHCRTSRAGSDAGRQHGPSHAG